MVSEFTGSADTTVDGVSQRLGPRNTARERALARAWLKEQYAKYGYTLQEQVYASGVNVIAERKGTSPEALIISSHYDTVAGSPGADDDASGVIVGLAVAAAMARCAPEKTIRFVSFDEEEQGMVGSKAYAASLMTPDDSQLKSLVGVIQVEMAGYDRNNDGQMARVDCGHSNASFMADALDAVIMNQSLRLTPTSYCQGRSDHVTFWDRNVPAITLSELFFEPDASKGQPPADKNPCYHQSCDTAQEMNFSFMNSIARAVTHMAIGLTGAK